MLFVKAEFQNPARKFSPSDGRFLQTDPIGYWAGLNLYTYVDNNPINWADPFGLDKQKKDEWWKWGPENWLWQYVYGGGLPDPGFKERFWREFYKNRLPGAEWVSPWPIPGENWPKATALIGPTGAGATELVSRVAQRELISRATRDFTSFSATRSFAYVHGLKPAYWTASKFTQGVLLAPTVFYFGADIGTAIYSYWRAYNE